MNRTLRPALILPTFAAAVALPACPSSSACEDLSTCDPRDGGGAVDECLAKPDAPECLTEDKAFFVSASGDELTADGTKAKPFTSLASALGKITPSKKRIYVCDGSYPEDVVLDANHSGVSLFGGFTCDWLASPAKPTFGNGPLALKVTDATGIAIAGLAFDAKEPTLAGASSIAAFVSRSEVTFKHVSLVAAKGKAGDRGTLHTFTFPLPSALAGKNGGPPDNGAARSVTCEGDDTTSSTGGAGGESGFSGEPGTVGPPNGGTTSVCSGAGSVNTDGQSGVTPPAATGGTSLGQLLDEGWKPRAGADGAKGSAGQGGGGGFGLGGGHGGGGGAGGCGGAGGGGGQGGGASIALASLLSTVRVDASSLMANDAGDGGDGGDGQPGQSPGGVRGTGTGTSCLAGNGGPGAKGAQGAGGAGGISIGVLHKGSPPTLDAPTTAAIRVGAHGEGGLGGKPGAPPTGNDGPSGLAETVKDASLL